tara:strand:+ start:148 stop:519 length:372 start_codon:yes stop_codon:yes gene_type:complete
MGQAKGLLLVSSFLFDNFPGFAEPLPGVVHAPKGLSSYGMISFGKFIHFLGFQMICFLQVCRRLDANTNTFASASSFSSKEIDPISRGGTARTCVRSKTHSSRAALPYRVQHLSRGHILPHYL